MILPDLEERAKPEEIRPWLEVCQTLNQPEVKKYGPQAA